MCWTKRETVGMVSVCITHLCRFQAAGKPVDWLFWGFCADCDDSCRSGRGVIGPRSPPGSGACRGAWGRGGGRRQEATPRKN